MLTTSAFDELMYFTNEAKPPFSGLFSPEPNSPSTTSMPCSSCGGSNSCVTSVNRPLAFFVSNSRRLFSAQSAERRPLMLNKYVFT